MLDTEELRITDAPVIATALKNVNGGETFLTDKLNSFV
jgi:hypothetical protein